MQVFILYIMAILFNSKMTQSSSCSFTWIKDKMTNLLMHVCRECKMGLKSVLCEGLRAASVWNHTSGITETNTLNEPVFCSDNAYGFI